ncbi:MAG TPA: CBS domain-containing protein [Minicystis sp.]|nr:CBS domain-containing protein [Minicystis sp.]
MNIGELMQHHVHSCHADDTLHDAARLMWDHAVGALPVLNRDGYVVGFLTDRDVAMGAYTTGRALATIRVADSMSKSAVTCHAHQDVGEAELLMREHRVRRLPVVDDAGRLVGLVSLDDIARHVVFGFDGAAGPLGGDTIAMTLASASERPPAAPVH